MEQNLSNQEKIRTFGKKETYKYLGILEADNIKLVEMKEKLKKSISGEPESYSKPNYIARISSKGLMFPLVRYSGPLLKCTREELKQMDQRTRKLMTIHKALHSRDDTNRLYVSREEGGRGLTSIQDSVDT